MGDRGNIAVESRGGRVWFYTHGKGRDLPETVRQALAKNERWDDADYLARIIFCTLVSPEFDSPTGYGIGHEPMDNSHPFVIVNVDKQIVTLEADPKRPYTWRGGHPKEVSFADFIKLEKASWEDLSTK